MKMRAPFPAVPILLIFSMFRLVASFSPFVSRRTISFPRHMSTVSDNGEGTNDDPLAIYRNRSNIRDQIFSALSTDGGVKVTAATVRNVVNDVMIMQTLTAVPADAIGRAMTCAALLSNGMQDEQIFQITMKGDGPLEGLFAVSNGKGELKGYVGSTRNIPPNMALSEAVGTTGTLQIVKNHPDWPNPYNGVTEIVHGDIDRDVGIYLARSEQRSCALAAATTVQGILCTSAGGYIVERLPDCDDETMAIVERNLALLVEKDGTGNLPAGLLAEGGTPLDLCESILDGLGMVALGQIEPQFSCECSEERLFRAVRLLPREEIDDIVQKEEKIEASCHFCGKVYRMGPEEVAKKFEEANGDPSVD